MRQRRSLEGDSKLAFVWELSRERGERVKTLIGWHGTQTHSGGGFLRAERRIDGQELPGLKLATVGSKLEQRMQAERFDGGRLGGGQEFGEGQTGRLERPRFTLQRHS
jgi:hypothetical protein